MILWLNLFVLIGSENIMETTQNVGEDFRVIIPSPIRRVMNIDVHDDVVIDVKEVIKKEMIKSGKKMK